MRQGSFIEAVYVHSGICVRDIHVRSTSEFGSEDWEVV